MILKNNRTFHLRGKDISYVIVVNEQGDLIHYYFGRKISDKDYSIRTKNERCSWLTYDENGVYLEAELLEYPTYGFTDLRMPAYSVRNRYGNLVSRLSYKDYKIKKNSTVKIKGMPSLYVGEQTAETLEIILADERIGLEVSLYYTVFEEYNIILRSSKFTNKSVEAFTIETAYSSNLDFEKNQYDIVYFPGSWLREREFTRTEIKLGEKIDISNARGGSGHAMNPFVMLCSKDANENCGEVYSLSLIYSGNHSTFVECDQFGKIRIAQGINPFDFEYRLNSNEVFYTPQSVICYSKCGFGGISREMHDVYRNNLCKSKWAKKDRPILINNWEATYFDFTEEKLIDIVQKAKEIGIELFVLDDGWFGARNDDKSSLGDWNVNLEKIPSGLNGLAKKINNQGLHFGIWFEPEMVNENSELYTKHPEWIIRIPNANPSFGRSQYILDLTNDDVCAYIVASVANILDAANISYVKWDYNRVMTNMPYKGYNHRYTLGLYKVLEELSTKFPDVLFEGCAGGGGRFDPGILAYSPQIWTSDNSDAVSRLKIQYSTSMCYPLSAISAHVTASPNHQVGRVTSLKTRSDVAFFGILGYELDITKLSEAEVLEIKEQLKVYQEIREIVRNGDFYRIQSPYEGNYCSWQVVSKDKTESVLFCCRIMSLANSVEEKSKLQGLIESMNYEDYDTGIVYGGDELMYKGIAVEYEKCDFSTVIKRFKTI